MNKTLKFSLCLVLLIAIAGSGYIYVQKLQKKSQLSTSGQASSTAQPGGEVVFPESQLNALTPQINQVAVNIMHYIDTGDAGKIGSVWDASSELAQHSVNREDFISSLQNTHHQMGKLMSRDYINTIYKSFTKPGKVPPGQYITVNYLAKFANEKTPRSESVVFVYNQAQWKLVGYTILNNK
ncbi:hypothetical protein TUM12370_17530 [Salmonella enterica subsp. enterica serovar Choleraesuis]|nr:hypothetical protein TUM12370_17530 [Salmonella enterica subsp. enterica serovar Choleraesuis]